VKNGLQQKRAVNGKRGLDPENLEGGGFPENKSNAARSNHQGGGFQTYKGVKGTKGERPRKK